MAYKNPSASARVDRQPSGHRSYKHRCVLGCSHSPAEPVRTTVPFSTSRAMMFSHPCTKYSCEHIGVRMFLLPLSPTHRGQTLSSDHADLLPTLERGFLLDLDRSRRLFESAGTRKARATCTADITTTHQNTVGITPVHGSRGVALLPLRSQKSAPPPRTSRTG